MRSLRSYMLNGLLRCSVKRRISPDEGIARMRQRIARWDARVAKPVPEHWLLAGQGPVDSQWIVPPNADDRRVILYFHGGGFCLHLPHQYQSLLARLADKSRAHALMVNYRLAPEHPYPAAPDDCLTAYTWLLEQGFDSQNIVLAGDSAGGCLVLVTLRRIKDQGLPMPAAGVLFSPATEMTGAGRSLIANDRKDPMFRLQTLLLFRQHYVRDHLATDPDISPYYADYQGFPPLMIQVGSSELLLDDAVMVAQKAKRAGVEVRLRVWPGMAHVFPVIFPLLPESHRALDMAVSFMRRKADWVDEGLHS